ncbi:hypothetical protein JW968_01710 [Candidatus Woesearchaeota archaeon]|nr:hypothetical protein [Candidatus Woesearchaeota archaeon]
MMRGKKQPADIDMLLVFKQKVDKDLEYVLRKRLEVIDHRITLISKIEGAIRSPDFDAREGILFEGMSLITGRYLADGYGFSSLGFFIYSTKGMSNVQKTKFYYALNGRGSSIGVIRDIEGIRISDNVIAVPLSKIELAKDFFDHVKIEYRYLPVMIPKRMFRRDLLSSC